MKAVQQAVKLGIIHGYEDGTFRPNANITHAEMISMVIRASSLVADNSPLTSFSDDADIPKWAKPAVSKAEETGIINVGDFSNGKFAPQAMSTRAEAASAIVRMLEIRE
ncbi:S-layer homology domain-containing protein [Paenibacillus sp. D2_2]|uniref:S-layer homology domain-containing protein n=1 Tax=Paenibacillus sp. D2_2 TaxID=3073092 RepID=UPI002814C303|nr:S-layer homology domain-containing protein [Paenibacillus sp. D2_2]WMT41763.1 S-layer homology domain-containing protein [Paenibacillus sp. D2_2]